MKVTEALYRLAIAFWVGGNAIFTLVLTPILFKSEARDIAARIVGLFFPSYFRWGMACGAVALICRLFVRRGDVAAAILVVMLAITAVQGFYVEPRAAELKRQIVSFEKTSKEDPLRKEFSRLHAVSAVANLVVLGAGVVLVILL